MVQLARRAERSNEAGGGAGAETLEARNVCVYFEGIRAIDGVDLTLRRGEILGLIGPNGAGKTTLVNVLTGFQRGTAGTISLEAHDVTDWPPARLARAGLARTFQSVRLFHGLTIFENVESAAVATGLSRGRARELAAGILERTGLAGRAHLPGSGLPHGDERRLGIARALATRPHFLLLDEPAAGLNEVECDELVLALARIRDDFELGLLVIEHDMRLIMRLCERIQVIDYGKTIAIGSPEEVRRNSAVLEAYLGTRSDADADRR